MTETMTTREKRPKLWKGALFIFVLCLVGAGLGGFAYTQRSVEGPKVAATAPKPLTVTVAPAHTQDSFQLAEKFSGLATASRESELGFTGGGRVISLAVDVGGTVRKGEVLARLDTRSLEAELRAAEASIEEARASETIAEATERRQETLLEQGHVAPQSLDEFAAQTEAARARVAAAGAQADMLRVQIDLSTITAPFDGVVTDRFMDEGVIANPGAPVFRLVETGPMEARIGLPAGVAERLQPGAEYVLVANERELPATLRSVTGVIDARARTVMSVFEIAPEQAVAAGTVLRLSMDETISETGIWVPVSSLTEVSRGVWSVLIAEDQAGQAIARPRTVTIVHTDGNRAYVRGALANGDLVILDGLQRVTPNQPVLPKEVVSPDQFTALDH